MKKIESIGNKLIGYQGKPLRKDTLTIGFLCFAILVIAASVWGPEALAGYKDKSILNETHLEEIQTAGEGYRYTLNGNERLYILSQCLSSQTLPGSEQNAWTGGGTADVDYQELGEPMLLSLIIEDLPGRNYG